MSTASNRAQSQSTQTETQSTREVMALAPFIADHVMRNKDVVTGALSLANVSYLPANDEQKSTYGGLLQGFIDPVSGKPCSFTGRDGQVVIGGCPVRLFGDDADFCEDELGLEPASTLHLGIKPDAAARVYRKDDGTVAFLAIRLADLNGEFGWEGKVEFKRKG